MNDQLYRDITAYSQHLIGAAPRHPNRSSALLERTASIYPSATTHPQSTPPAHPITLIPLTAVADLFEKSTLQLQKQSGIRIANQSEIQQALVPHPGAIGRHDDLRLQARNPTFLGDLVNNDLVWRGLAGQDHALSPIMSSLALSMPRARRG